MTSRVANRVVLLLALLTGLSLGGVLVSLPTVASLAISVALGLSAILLHRLASEALVARFSKGYPHLHVVGLLLLLVVCGSLLYRWHLAGT